MKINDYIETLEKEAKAGEQATQAQHYLIRAYAKAKKNDFTELILQDIIQDEFICELIDEIKKSEIETFVFACGFSGSIETLSRLALHFILIESHQEIYLHYDEIERIDGIKLGQKIA